MGLGWSCFMSGLPIRPMSMNMGGGTVYSPSSPMTMNMGFRLVWVFPPVAMPHEYEHGGLWSCTTSSFTPTDKSALVEF